ncbi:MAG: calcium-binding protein, partial [Hyphomicrobium sp.]
TFYGTVENDDVHLHGGNDVFIDIAGGNDAVYDVGAYRSSGTTWSGKDVISTGTGNDTVFSSLDSSLHDNERGGQEYYGGVGLDMLNLSYNQTGVYVDLSANQAVNIGTGESTRAVSFEWATGSNLADQIYGDDQINLLRGLSGDDQMFGRGGDDAIDGGTGQDKLFGGSGNDNLGGGTGDDVLYGGTGIDVVEGEAGNDVLLGEDGNDAIQGQDGNDILKGGNGNDQLYGQTGNDNLDGSAGADELMGGLGRDLMSGGAGADQFIFEALSESVPGALADTIFDFQHRVDKIDLSLIDARTNVAGNQAFSYIGDHGFSSSGQIKSHYFAAQNTTVVSLNTDADGAAEMTINLTGHISLSSIDFVL